MKMQQKATGMKAAPELFLTDLSKAIEEKNVSYSKVLTPHTQSTQNQLRWYNNK